MENAVKKYYSIMILIPCLLFIFCGVVEQLTNRDPIIKSVTASPNKIGVNDTTLLKVVAEDPDDDILEFRWDSSSKGQFISNIGAEVRWIAPSYSGQFRIKVQVTDENGGKASGEAIVNVREENDSPIVTITIPVENEVIPGLGNYGISVSVAFIWQIEQVDFFIDGDLLFTDKTTPYEWKEWNVTSLSGAKTIVAKAYEAGDLLNYGVDSVHVIIEGIVPIPKR